MFWRSLSFLKLRETGGAGFFKDAPQGRPTNGFDESIETEGPPTFPKARGFSLNRMRFLLTQL
jgi:hypothetical protein